MTTTGPYLISNTISKKRMSPPFTTPCGYRANGILCALFARPYLLA